MLVVIIDKSRLNIGSLYLFAKTLIADDFPQPGGPYNIYPLVNGNPLLLIRSLELIKYLKSSKKLILTTSEDMMFFRLQPYDKDLLVLGFPMDFGLQQELTKITVLEKKQSITKEIEIGQETVELEKK